jgi:hypothetical protein
VAEHVKYAQARAEFGPWSWSRLIRLIYEDEDEDDNDDS